MKYANFLVRNNNLCFRWNLSVGEHSLSLAKAEYIKSKRTPERQTYNSIRYKIRPPDGVVNAIDSCGNKLWCTTMDSPIAKAWEIFDGKLVEVNNYCELKCTNIHRFRYLNRVILKFVIVSRHTNNLIRVSNE